MTVEQILALSNDSDKGCIVECDLEYPSELHAAHSDYPLAPQTLAVDASMLSPYQLTLMNELKTTGLKTEKLVPNLFEQGEASRDMQGFAGLIWRCCTENSTYGTYTAVNDVYCCFCRYVLHYRSLKLYVQLGMKVGTIHRVLRFKQDPWMKG